LDVQQADGGVEVSIPRSTQNITVPLRVSGLNPRWSVGLLQKQGFVAGHYGPGIDRYRALAVTEDGTALVPLNVSRSEVRVLAGHPIVADRRGRDLFIQVTCLGWTPSRWHISVNNPTQHIVETTLSQALALPDIAFQRQSVTLAPGELRTLR
jgi:hypothetical protein